MAKVHPAHVGLAGSFAQTPVIRRMALGQANSLPNRPIARVCLLNASSPLCSSSGFQFWGSVMIRRTTDAAVWESKITAGC